MADPTELTHATQFSAYVSINDAPVPVYKVVVKPDLRKTTCYIEAVTGAEFKVHYRDDQLTTSADWCAWIDIDGKPMTGTILDKSTWGGRHAPQRSLARVNTWAGRPSGHASEQPFVFSAPTLTDDVASAVNDEHIIKNLATIQVRIHRGYKGQPVGTQYTAVTETVLHEKAKKAMVSHTAKLGAAKAAAVRTSAAFDYIDSWTTPYWTFEFKYLSRAAPTPSVSPPPAALKKEKHANAAAKGKGKRTTITIDSDDESDDAGAGEDGDEEGGDSKAELKKLREKIAKLEGEGGEKKKVKREKVVMKEEKDKDGKVVFVLD
ncbi:hypothetical protein RQP46_005069 [Phenoliferia psychrophenolica]